MGFVANGNNTPSQIEIKSDPFYPSVALDRIREIVRIDGAVTNERLKQTIIEEVIDINRLLIRLKDQASKLSDLSKLQVNDLPETDFLYLSAIANGVAAKVNENYRNYDSSDSGVKKAKEAECTVDDYRRNKQWAIQQLLGENHTVVELI
ncbi:head completion/stabilization protein [Acinetobacter baumannii]|uniref:head completion/stabilization protein n=1 Tax=Acinetobacter TaxID=469 RepID=UPI0003B9241A|nr:MULTISPECIES: head completion/stabilization protein [Acinetobacter]EHU1429321.1 head completion/stabilization protein [Acinetobacter baumannii]EHU1559151.1 head completion/stabilization protein [Acinetobacter baumannii]EHU2510186.1 head completion/stabilization protein [Acinetobacter baumannii]EJB8577445.1 head completion/stabilization protein [Acinetobacter baumannii]MBV6561948.1 head completion/stabilization protein [Acinetobacter baumannii]